MTSWTLHLRSGQRSLDRLVRRVLVGVAGILTVLVVLALAGAAKDDASINARIGEATAEVLAVSSLRTAVQFVAADGQVYRPAEGLAYPSGLRVGQQVRVEYDRAQPELVRVAGRSWVTGLRPAAVTLGALWALVLLACLLVRARTRPVRTPA